MEEKQSAVLIIIFYLKAIRRPKPRSYGKKSLWNPDCV